MGILYLFLHTGTLPVVEMATDAVYFKMMELNANEAFNKFSLEYLSCMSGCFTWNFTFWKQTNKQIKQLLLLNCSKRPNHKQKLSRFFFISALNCYRYEDTLCICPCCCRFLSVTFLLRASGTQWM